MKLNLGCGKRYLKGYINVDIKKPCDLIHDLNKYPYPFSDVEFIKAHHIIEHLNNPLMFLKEAERILMINGIIEIEVPGEAITFNTLEHTKPITPSSIKDNGLKIVSVKYVLCRWKKAYSYLCCVVCNIFGYRIVDNTFIKFLFPYYNVKITLQKRLEVSI